MNRRLEECHVEIDNIETAVAESVHSATTAVSTTHPRGAPTNAAELQSTIVTTLLNKHEEQQGAGYIADQRLLVVLRCLTCFVYSDGPMGTDKQKRNHHIYWKIVIHIFSRDTVFDTNCDSRK